MSLEALNLYAKIESMIGFDEAYERLYEIYLNELKNYSINSLLDIGCGNGNFLLKVQKEYDSFGIDLSKSMIEIATSKGAKAKCMSLEEVDNSFDAIVAIGDVINYIKPQDLRGFLKNIEDRLNSGGVFLCDLNTLHGFEDVTAGSLVVDRDDEFLSIDAEFFEGVLESEIVYFKKVKECFKKQKERIFQYFYESKDLEDITDLRLVEAKKISMFSDKADKMMLVFKDES